MACPAAARRCASAFLCLTWAFATSAEGSQSSGGVVMQGTEYAVQLPKDIVFTQKVAPLADVHVEQGVPAPEAGSSMSVTLSVDSDKRLHLHSDKAKSGWVPLAWAEYRNDISKSGWAFLSVTATKDPKVSDDLKMYAAGFLEGFSSAKQIKEFQHNANALMHKDEKNHQAIGNIRTLYDKETQTMLKKAGMNGSQALSNSNQPKDAWWRHTKFMLMQAWGILDAYNQHVDKLHGTPMSMVDLLILNSDGETPELEMAYDFEEVLLRQSQRDCDHKSGECDDDDNSTSGESFLQKRTGAKRRVLRGQTRSPYRDLVLKKQAHRKQMLRHWNDKRWRQFKRRYGRCSALVRLAPNNSDIFMGHTTFSDYSEMNRIWKYYDFPLGAGASQTMGFSSYPGVAGSTDDYYLMDTGLAVTETTVSMLSDEAFDKLDDNGTFVPDYMRIMIANRLAKNGQEWVEHMKKSATGTYNSQWMVVDYKLFKPGQKLKDGTFWVLEQAPGVSHAQDMSSNLQKTGFWGSENRAFFADIRKVSGEAEAEETSGDLFSATKNPRANIFTKTAPEVVNLAGMRAEMQRNKWPNDVDGGPANTPDHAIAARGDLDKSRPDPNGGVDSKVTNACLARLLAADAIAGPTHDDHKPFRWTDEKTGKPLYPDYPRDGLPDLWNFDWVRFTPKGELRPLPHGECSAQQ